MRRALVVLFLAAAALLVLMTSRAQGPATIAAQRSAIARPDQARGRPSRSAEATASRPRRRASRSPVKLKLPLRSGLLFDVRTGQVLWQRNPTQVVAIASLTKMMTALVVAAKRHAQRPAC